MWAFDICGCQCQRLRSVEVPIFHGVSERILEKAAAAFFAFLAWMNRRPLCCFSLLLLDAALEASLNVLLEALLDALPVALFVGEVLPERDVRPYDARNVVSFW